MILSFNSIFRTQTNILFHFASPTILILLSSLASFQFAIHYMLCFIFPLFSRVFCSYHCPHFNIPGISLHFSYQLFHSSHGNTFPPPLFFVNFNISQFADSYDCSIILHPIFITTNLSFHLSPLFTITAYFCPPLHLCPSASRLCPTTSFL